MSSKGKQLKQYTGCNYFRQRLVLSTLSGIPVRISDIRSAEDEPGLQEFEASFLRLLDAVTNGSKIEVNETGTSVLLIPGMLIGGTIDHDCNLQRSIGYYLESLVMLAPFCKQPVRATLRGVTNCPMDTSVDTIKYVTLPLLKKFGIDDERVELKINKRGVMPGGGGEVFFTCPAVRKLRPLQFTEAGKLKRARGTAYCMKVAPAAANRIVDATRGVLNQFLSDVYIYTDHVKGAAAGNDPGFGVSLMVESTTGVMLSADACSSPRESGDTASIPEDIGRVAAEQLLVEVFRGGCVDSAHQPLALLCMALAPMDVSRLLIGPPTEHTVHFMRHMRDFFDVVYKITRQKSSDEERTGSDEKYILSCVGVGFTNLSKTSI